MNTFYVIKNLSGFVTALYSVVPCGFVKYRKEPNY